MGIECGRIIHHLNILQIRLNGQVFFIGPTICFESLIDFAKSWLCFITSNNTTCYCLILPPFWFPLGSFACGQVEMFMPSASDEGEHIVLGLPIYLYVWLQTLTLSVTWGLYKVQG